MRAAMAIFKREFAARLDMLLVAGAAAGIAVLMPLLPGLEHFDPADVRNTSCQVLVLVIGFGLGCGLGATVIGSDLSAIRLGFFFARPVAGSAVWAGRTLAALAIVLTAEVLVIAPVFVEHGVFLFEFDGYRGWKTAAVLVGLPALVLLLSHAVSVMLRARTAWLFLDLAGLLAIAAGSWVSVHPLALVGAVKAVSLVGSLLVGAAVIALAAAGLVGTAVGRTDLRRTHGALSVTLWLVLGVLVAGTAAYGTWLRDFGPRDLHQIEVLSVAPDGGWIEVAGSTPRRLDVWRRFLVSTADGRWIALPVSARSWYDTRYSADGSTAAMFEPSDFDGAGRTLWWSDLRDRDPRIRETKIVVSGWATLHLSPDGSRLALLSERVLSVYDLESERLVQAISIPENLRNALVFFREDSHLSLFARRDRVDDAPLFIAGIDLESGHVSEIARIEGIPARSWIAVDAEVTRIVVNSTNTEDSATHRRLYDAKTGAVIRDLDIKGFLRFLSDGRIVALSKAENGHELLVAESADGVVRLEHDLGAATDLDLHGEAVAGSLVVSRLGDLEDRELGRTMELIDIESGQTLHIAEGLRRGYFGGQYVWGAGVTAFWYQNTPHAGRIFQDRTGAIVRWEPSTGDLIHIVGGAE